MKKDVLKRVSTLITFVTLGFLLQASYADTLKIGYIDMQRILANAPLYKAGEKRLTEEFKSRQDELIIMQKRVANKENELRALGANSSQKSAIESELNKLKASFEIRSTRFAKEVQVKRTEELQKINNELRAIIEKIAKRDGFSILLNSHALLFVDTKIDITDRVLKELK